MITRIALWFAAILVAGGILSGCATAGMPANATVSQKLAADLLVVARMESDVKNSCGPDFAPLAPTVASILEVIVDAAAENIAGAVGQAALAYPALAADVKGMECVVSVLKADWAQYKPSAKTPKPVPVPAARPLAP